MNYEEMKNIVLEQSAKDMMCDKNDFLINEITVVSMTDDETACTDDCDSMWQIGVDVLPEFRGKNIASFLVNKLSHKIFEKGKIPYYCTAWSNISSRNTAIKAGFTPAWVEIASVEW
ncbi:MAG: GNAT family N-acetyltransferase [Treponemataceae bacterium]|nr:GNAT family N-acetyltransferase [Treponemataceae bacterium]